MAITEPEGRRPVELTVTESKNRRRIDRRYMDKGLVGDARGRYVRLQSRTASQSIVDSAPCPTARPGHVFLGGLQRF